MFKFSATVAASVAALAGVTPASAANLFVNGGFDNAGFGGTGSYYNVGIGADHLVPGDFGWSVPINNVDIIANGVYAPAAPGGGGLYSLDLVGYGASGAISQTIATVAGRYTVAFDFTKNGGVVSPTATVKVNGTAIATAVGTSNWQNFNSSFISTGGPTIITIAGIGSGSGGVILDNVSLTKGKTPPQSFFALAPVMLTLTGGGPNLLGNGDFENTGFGGTSSYYNLGTGGDHPIPGDFAWGVPINNVDIIANGAYGPALATGGAYGLDLVGYGSTGAINQSINTVAGKRYTVSVDYAANGGFSGPTANVMFNGAAIGALTGASAWQTFTTTIVGTGGPASFGFATTLGGNSGGIFLDNAVVAAAVPEPGTWAMLVIGFGMVGGILRGKRPAKLGANRYG